MTMALLDVFMLVVTHPPLAQAPSPEPSAGGGTSLLMNLGTITTLLFGAGGAGALGGLIALVNAWRKGRLESQQTLIERLNADSKQQGERADAAEADLASLRRSHDAELVTLRRQRDRARDVVAHLRQFLISEGYEMPSLDDYYGP